ncbi:hypothetical protein [Streptomyces sp. NPDC052610]|uniref:hypothetical protein n=1 Tax=Streptomyces sp. NPDC052610 TaxID=3154952 RepID=UPI003416B9A5
MPRSLPSSPARTGTRLTACALAAAALLGAAACSAIKVEAEPRGPATPSASSRAASSAAPARSPAPATAPALTDAQAREALIGATDLGEPWTATKGAATWRDAFLKTRAAQGTDPDCQRLLDALYADELLGAPARAVVALDDWSSGSQLRYQVTAQRPAEVDRTLAWMRTLPGKCAGFSATTASGTEQRVAVNGAPLPEVGDARQALRLTVTIEYEGEPVTLTLHAVAVRVGDDALTLTNGGLGDVSPEVTTGVTELGAERLGEVRRHGRVQV